MLENIWQCDSTLDKNKQMNYLKQVNENGELLIESLWKLLPSSLGYRKTLLTFCSLLKRYATERVTNKLFLGSQLPFFQKNLLLKIKSLEEALERKD